MLLKHRCKRGGYETVAQTTASESRCHHFVEGSDLGKVKSRHLSVIRPMNMIRRFAPLS